MKSMIFFIILSFLMTANADVNVYSDRPSEKMDVITQAFKNKTGITVNALKLSADEIRTRLTSEGEQSPADVAIVKDLVYLDALVQDKLLQPLNSDFATQNVSPSMMSNYWTAITFRARTLVYDKSYDVSGIETYADLADPKYAGTLCLRTSKSTYNQALAASLINSYGESATFDIIGGWLDNLADFTKIHSSDSQIIKDIALQNTSCTLGITNSYYLGLLLQKDPTLPVGIKFLKLKDGGVSTNGIGAGITASSKNVDEARQFIEFMLSEDMQKYFSTANQDFPANTNVNFPENIQNWFGFETSQAKWENFVELVPDAKEMFEELDYL